MDKKLMKFGFLLILLSYSIYAKILDSLSIEGLVVQKREFILNNIPLKTGNEFNSSDIQKTIKKLYSLGLFKDINISIVKETEHSVSLLLKVLENPICESIEFNGMKKIKQKDLEDKISLEIGYEISDALIHENIKIIKNTYAEEGYLLASIDCKLIESKVPGNVIVKFDVKEGKKVRIKKISFTGNKAFTEKKLKRKFKTKERKWFNTGEYLKHDYQSHIDSLLFFYQDKGYLDAKVVRDSVFYSDNNTDIYIDIVLDEGKCYYTGDFFFTGNKVLGKDALRACIAMKKDKPFNTSKFKMTKIYISNAYREEGYLWVQLRQQNHFRGDNGDTIDVTFDIVEGRPAIVHKVDIVGNNKTREKVIRREITIYPGQKYKQTRMERSIREITMLGYFENVTPDLRPNEDGTIDLVYSVEEKETVGQFSAGIMYSQVDKLGGNFSISMANFRGAGQTVTAKVEFSKKRQNYDITFEEPWIFDTPTSFNTRVFYETEKYHWRTGLVLGIGRGLKWPDDYFRAYMNYNISYEKDERTFDEYLPDFTILKDGLLSKVIIALIRDDTRPIPQFPSQGSILRLETEIAGLGGDYHFVKSVFSYNWYFPLFWKFVLGMKSKFGILDGIRKDKVIGNNDLFSAGGVYDDGQIRGYSEMTFGRRYNQGLTMLVLSSEISFPILERQLYFGIFADAGNTWDDVRDIDFNDLYPGVGFGIRLDLPMVGLLGFDFAWPLKDPENPHFDKKLLSKPEVHFIMQRGF